MSQSITADNLFSELRQVQPEYQKVVRLTILVWLLIGCAGFGFLAFILIKANDDNLAYSLVVLIPILFFLSLFFIYPKKVYKYTHYGLVDEVFYVQKGWLFKKRTAVAQNRIQHTDVEQGPFLRKYGLAQLILHTAGVKEADISISGLEHTEAIAIRDHLLEWNKQKSRQSKERSKAVQISSVHASSLQPTEHCVATTVLALNQDLSRPVYEEE